MNEVKKSTLKYKALTPDSPIGYEKHLDTTFIEQLFLRDLINRLTAKGYKGLLLHEPKFYGVTSNHKLIRRVPNFALPKLGLVIEIDGLRSA